MTASSGSLRRFRTRRFGEAVLPAVLGLDKPSPQVPGTSSMEVPVESLRAVGLEPDARALAIEAVAAR